MKAPKTEVPENYHPSPKDPSQSRASDRDVGSDCSDPNPIVKSYMAGDCDINNIMARYEKTGVLEHINPLQPRWGELTLPPNFHEIHNILVEAEQDFMALPAKLRARFENDPINFLSWVQDKENLPEMAELGLLNPEATERILKQKEEAAAPKAEPPKKSKKAPEEGAPTS